MERVFGETDPVARRVEELRLEAALLGNPAWAKQRIIDGGLLRGVSVQGAVWARGWHHLITRSSPRHQNPNALREVAGRVREWLTPDRIADFRERSYWSQSENPTRRMTRALTSALEALQDHLDYPNGRCEVTIPVMTSESSSNYGRSDVALLSSSLERPDIVIEIDSQPNQDAVRKLRFAADAGALPVWVRHGKGPVPVLDGVAVIDVRPDALARAALRHRPKPAYEGRDPGADTGPYLW
ncbi:hypothetical protein [Streptomyces nymphaeiformis]|uniref:Uncharacterized protein n=1 Tax=Streptomyces nymphaeiformis TaxID=2663842 RepID=A0A7W7XCY7_9ACTN|nr:hypothetical protein [Streptomyces nymphaeiformis]MBB4984154.1 hypothetical protein [Streptomyces nymphaeiformis]